LIAPGNLPARQSHHQATVPPKALSKLGKGGTGLVHAGFNGLGQAAIAGADEDRGWNAWPGFYAPCGRSRCHTAIRRGSQAFPELQSTCRIGSTWPLLGPGSEQVLPKGPPFFSALSKGELNHAI
jgi:hypothetical protein